MKRLSLSLAAAVAACALFAEESESAQAADSAESPAARLERCKRLVARYQPSTVCVRYEFKLDEEGEPPDVTVRYKCPNCGSDHERHAEHYLSRNTPFEALGYALSPTRILLQDLMVQPKWVKSIEVEFNGVKYPAKEVLRYPKEGGVLVETEKPIEGIRPLEFAEGGVPEKPAYFYVVRENGLTVSGVKGSGAASFKHYAATGRDFYAGAANTLVVNEKDEAVTVALQSKVELGKEQFAPPSKWTSVPASAFADEIAAMERRVAEFVVPLYARLESESKDSGRSYRGGGDETYDVGFALDGGEVLIPANLSAEQTARLSLVEYTAPDGKKTKLEFVGSVDEWGAFIVRFPDGRLPDGIRPTAFCTMRPEELVFGKVFSVSIKNNSGKLKIRAREQVLQKFEQSWGGSLAPAIFLASGRSSCSIGVAPDGSMLAIELARRQSTSRWSSDSEFALCGPELVRVATSHSFNPEYVPRTEADRNRMAWIGVEVMRLTSEAAREKKVTEFLRHDSDGMVVTKVYPGTPAAGAGIKEGDILLTVRPEKSQKAIGLSSEGDYGSSYSWSFDDDDSYSSRYYSSRSTPWPNAEGGINAIFSRLGIGSKVIVAWVSDRVRREAPMTLAQLPVHYNNARRSRNRDIGMTVCDMTYEVRSFFRFDDDAPGVVISKLKPGDPAAVAGLSRNEIITDVNGKPVKSAKEFGAAIKGQKELTFSVRRLTATRIVRISLASVKDDKAPEKK